MTFRAVLFDLGQTLLHYAMQGRWPEFRLQRLAEIYPLVCEICGDPGVAPEAFAGAVCEVLAGEKARAIEASGRSWHLAERLREGLAEVGVSCDEAGLVRLTEAFCEPIGGSTKPYPEAAETLEHLRAAGLRLAIVSNTYWDAPGRVLRGDLRRWGMERCFDAMVFSGDVPWRKPNPEFMLAAAKDIGVEPEECFVVGDSLRADIAGARAAGMQSVWMNRGGEALPTGEIPPDWTVTSLSEVVGIAGR